MITELKKEDFVVGFLIMSVIFGLMYQGFSFLISVQDVAQHIHFT